MATCKRIISEKGRTKVIDQENYVYTKNKENADGSVIYWRCEDRTCKARLHSSQNFQELKKVGCHNHAATAAEISAKVAVSNIKEKSISTRDNPRILIANEFGNLNDCALSQVPSLTQLNRSIRRWRQVDADYPTTPHTNIGFSIPREYAFLDNEVKFLQFDSGIEDSKRILIFASDEGLGHVKQYKKWATDGTFKFCPSLFFQLYVLHIQNGSFEVPRIFALLSDTTQ